MRWQCYDALARGESVASKSREFVSFKVRSLFASLLPSYLPGFLHATSEIVKTRLGCTEEDIGVA